MNEPQRLCPVCHAGDAICLGEPTWPPGWQCPACGWQVPEIDGIPMFAPALADTISGFDPVSFDKLSRIEAKNFWFVARNELIVGLANKYFPNARRYLEIGCGNGAVLQALWRSRKWDCVAGTELHPMGLAHARRRLPTEVEFAQVDATAIPVENAFDLAGAFDIIEHVAEDEAALGGLRRAVVDGGGTIIAVPQHPWLWSRADDIGHHQRRYRVGEIEAKMKRNGFEILFSSSYATLLLPLMALSRLKARYSKSDKDVEREMSPGPAVNAVLTAILQAEVRLTLSGWRWPWGGSRVVVARAI